MPNKLRRTKKAASLSKDRARQAEVMTIPEPSCSQEQHPAHAHGSAVTAAARKAELRQETLGAKCIKIAPIFLPTPKLRSDVKLHKSRPAPRSEDVHQGRSRQSERRRMSPSALKVCLQEIQTSNPAFPVRAVFSTLQKKTVENTHTLSSPHKRLKEKRKCASESSERVPKRLRSSLITEGAAETGPCNISAQGVQESSVPTAMKESRSNKLSRAYRLRQQSGTPAGVENHHCETYSEMINDTEDYSQSLETNDALPGDSSFEDLLWTDKYSPQHSNEVIGNSASVNKLQCWLKKWKARAVSDERRTTEERKQEANSSESWDCGDFQGEAGAEEDREEPLCNTVLITGPPGVGKTAAVYACCQELGFKVFEVNCSSQRSGCHVLSQLKEATQSHLVEMSGKGQLKPTYFNNYVSASKVETLPGKTAPQKKLTFTSKRKAAQNFGPFSRKRNVNPAAVTLARFFKSKAKADHFHFSGLSPSEKPDDETWGSSSPRSRNTATSLILFEEVDVIFDDDVGFLAAVKTFMTTTKRPVVLTTNDPSFGMRFSCSLEEIIFKAPSAGNVCSYLQLVALAENVRLEADDVRSLLRLCSGDVRRCLLQLQLWGHSGGGWASLPKEPVRVRHLSADDAKLPLPQFETGCTASMLPLHPVTQTQLLNLLQRPLWSEVDMTKLLSILAESWRSGVPLLYANLELLLPFETKGTSVHLLDERTCSGQSELAAPGLHIHQLDGSPKTPATDNGAVRNRLSRRRRITAMSDGTPSSSLTQTPQSISLSSKRTHLRAQSSTDPPEQSLDYLDALSHFFDLMSHLDATTPAAAPLVSGSCRPDAFVWAGARIMDGLLDERSEEQDNSRWSQERMLDIQAAVEGLGCRRCLRRLSDGWTEVQVETLPAPFNRRSLSFSFQPLCAPSVLQRRYELSRTVLCSNSFSLLGNRKAVTVDYMPVLRYICRLQREEPDRCLNYLSRKHLGLSKSTIQFLAQDLIL